MPTPFSLQPRRPSLSAAGGGNLRVIIILAALAISGVIFFVFTRPAMKTDKAAKPDTAPVLTKAEPVPNLPVAPPKPKVLTPPTPPAPPPAPPPPPAFGFARPQDLGKEMLRSLAAGDFDKVGKLAAAADPTQEAAAAKIFENMVKSLGAKAGLENQVELLGMVENKTRLSVPLILPGQALPARIQLDLERDERMGWKITGLRLPKELAAALPPAPPAPAPMAAATPGAPKTTPAPTAATTPGAPKTTPAPMVVTAPGTAPKTTPTATATTPAIPPAPGTGAKMPAKPSSAATVTVTPPPPRKMPLFTVDETPDALTFASDFVRALLKHDFVTAKKFVDEKKVAAERLIGLCIVFEEGKYEFKPNKPLIITVANPEVSWVIAQVQSPSLEQSTEFGLELQRMGTDQPWQVVGLNLSEILSSFAASAAKLGIPYTPIVTNPTGGESLALYFEYDQAQLHPRAQKQLEIVASLLKSDATRKLQIAGHTDAKGPEDYNIQLSQSRAESVKKQLVALGVPASQVVTTGMGKAQPLGPNQKADGSDDPAGRSKNRRAEIYLDF